MARKYDLISELYERTCFAMTDNPVNWQNFLKTAGRNFRLRFDEQLLLYAQRPEATAVLEIEKWNRTFGRWVNKGATGIAVFEEFGGKRQRLTHYFDISDTHSSRYARPVPIWEMEKQHEQDVMETLENTFGVAHNDADLAKVIMDSVSNAVDDNIADYLSDFNDIIAGSDMEYLPENEREAMYVSLVKNSVAYMMMARLGIETKNYYSVNDFNFIKKFNSQDTLNAVGFATSDIAEMGLMPVSRTINAYTKENRTIDRNRQSDYNKDNQKIERDVDNETD
ncbi:MAG: helicase, partial [Clostridia bacterium]|nr:helicase [Clostridia bacterium]